jgi:hypothetical protein
MLGTTEKPAVRFDSRLEPTVQGPKPATASPGYQQQKARHPDDGLFLCLPFTKAQRILSAQIPPGRCPRGTGYRANDKPADEGRLVIVTEDDQTAICS